MSKFKIIEQSRFLPSEMKSIKGGLPTAGEMCYEIDKYDTCGGKGRNYTVCKVTSVAPYEVTLCGAFVHISCNSAVTYDYSSCGGVATFSNWCASGMNHDGTV